MDKKQESIYNLKMAFNDLKHSQRERLEFLDKLFYWDGSANRADLITRFGISNPQAALDFRAFLEHAGDGQLKYDTKAKRYIANLGYNRLSGTAESSELAALLGFNQSASFDFLPDLQRTQNMLVFVPLFRALKSKQSVKITYQSMVTEEPTDRWILPTRFASDGVRIHVRAWCFLRKQYRDFHPARINPSLSFQETHVGDDIPFDDDWHTWAHINLRPHSRLNKQQQNAVRVEFGFSDEILTIRIRKALEFYTKRRWGLEQPEPRLELVSTEYETFSKGTSDGN